jgi:hypothetical protein
MTLVCLHFLKGYFLLYQRAPMKAVWMVMGCALALAGASLSAQTSNEDNKVISGGIGNEDQQRIKQMASRYSLGLTFADTDGRYLSGVALTVINSKGDTVATHTDAGPLVLVDLPSGRYNVEAQYEGVKQQKTVELKSGRHQKIQMRWRSDLQ